MCARTIAMAGIWICVSVPALADEGRIPVFAPATLAAPGKYFVTTNISAASGPVIRIVSDDVDLDLNGFRLSGNGTAAALVAIGVEGIKIHNGTIDGGGLNISISDSSRVTIEKIHVVGATLASGAAIDLFNTMSFSIRRVIARGAAGTGIRIRGDLMGGSIEDSQFQDCDRGGIEVEAFDLPWPISVRIHNNRIQVADGWGITVTSSTGVLVSENTIDGPGVKTGDGGILLEGVQDSKIQDNIVSQAGGNGIFITSAPGIESIGNLIMNNVVGQSALEGIVVVGSRNVVEGNVLNRNAGFGLHLPFGLDNVYRRNTARGNGGAVCGVPGCIPDLCDEGIGNTSALDNFMPGPPLLPLCI